VHASIAHVIRRTLASVAAVACLFAATACSGNDKPTTGPAAVPSYAAKSGPEGAREFATYWVDLLNKATTSGKTAQFKAVAQKSCTTCLDFAKQLDEIYGAGGHVETEGWKVQAAVPEAGLPAGEQGVSVKVKVAPQTVVKKKGAKAEQHDGGNLRIRLVLTRADDSWAVKALDIG
jgi:hypothetical protein